MILALAGNQNCGKTALFNRLTGANRRVGNFPGVTVERKTGKIRPAHIGRHENDFDVADLPGIYSIRPYSSEEIVTRDFLIKQNPDGIINIVDATNIERNLYLSLQLIELGKPMVVALNMMDEVRGNGGTIDVHALSEALGVPVVPISAAKNEGIGELVETAGETARNRVLPKKNDFCEGAVHRCIHSIAHIIEDHAQKAGVSRRFAATKLIEGDESVVSMLNLNQNELELTERDISEMERELGMDRQAALADMRYAFIESVCKKTVAKRGESREYTRSAAIDRVLTNKFLALPLFLAVMFGVFSLTFEVIGAFLSGLLAEGIAAATRAASGALTSYGVNPVARGLIIDGAFTGVGTVLSFLPIIVTLFFFLSILEDSGYMARVAFIMDAPLRKIGLSGRSFVPMLMGFGCSVPAIMATRTLPSERDRKMTVLLTPFMSCSAKIPIYAVFAAAFFDDNRGLVMFSLYLAGIIAGIICAAVLNKTKFKGKPVPFVMELPNYRPPYLKSTALLLRDKAKDFITRAFTVIFTATVIIWFLRSFDTRLNFTEIGDESILAFLGKLTAPLFAPLGFGDWRASTALITGFAAKEAVVSSLSVLTGGDLRENAAALSVIFADTGGVFAFLVFTLLYTPCVAAVAAIKRELNSARLTLAVVFGQCAVAWVAAFIAGNPTALALTAVLLCLIGAVGYIAGKKRGKCRGCPENCDTRARNDARARNDGGE
ncbi:MAG: ferrous iron transport protein B [Oscillospiraceae bacterium]|jgi:ferrous iron transport protein B|nr:ferrous iron transport protein B [Oscillospiraceae bacterium]